MNEIKRLESLEQFGWRFGLESITALLEELGNPHQFLRCIHVAGSNGKGSTCAFMASFLKLSGAKTGLYTSPHLSDIRERFRINGVWISEADFDRHAKKVLDACGRVKRKRGHFPTHFEALTAMAFSWFQEKKVDWVVLEVGLGGRLDATNVISRPALCLITPVDLEHQNILGKTLKKIAWEKAGILKAGCPAATVQPKHEALRAVKAVAMEKNVSLWVGGSDFKFKKGPNGFRWEGPGLSKSFKLPDLPDYQITNAALALAGIQILRSRGFGGGDGLIQKSLKAARWPGRFEVLKKNPLVVLDGAHNPAAAEVLSRSLQKKYPAKRWLVLNGYLKDKDYASVIDFLKPIAFQSIVTESGNARAEKGGSIFKVWEKTGTPALLIRDWRKALSFSLSKGEKLKLPVLITGSLYLAGDCRNYLVGNKGLDRL